jgi:threonine dehydratase
MPEITPRQKIDKVRKFGGRYVEIVLTGKTFDDASAAANEYCTKHKMVYVHPFNDPRTISGQGTVGLEIYQQLPEAQVIVLPIGGGGLSSGVATYLKAKNKSVKIIAVDPAGAPKMVQALKNGGPLTLEKIDTFVDGAAVKRAGDITYKIIKSLVDKVITSPEGAVCKTMIELYQSEGIIAEPAGALSVSALEFLGKDIRGKTVVCIISGGNNDITRYPEIMERSLVYQGIKHYFIIEFAQKPGELKKFLEKVLGPGDDIVRFEYIKKTNKENGPALVGLELKSKQDFEPLLKRMRKYDVQYKIITSDDILYQQLI